MSSNRVLWGEGLFLRPQHFQTQDNHHATQRALGMRVTSPYAVGVGELVIDTPLLESNMLSILSLSCVFADGTLYHAPAIDNLPKPIALDAQEDGDEVYVFLSLELMRTAGDNISAGDDIARYARDSFDAKDQFSQAADASVEVIKLAPSLQLSQSAKPPGDDTLTVLLMKLLRNTQGHYRRDETYVVPSVHIDSNPALLNQISRLMMTINTKVSALYDHHRQSNNDLLEFRAADIASFWLMHALNTAYAALSHLANNPKLHPERLYAALLSTASQLTTFSSLYKVADLPAYQHHHANESFVGLMKIIRELLNTVIASNYVSIPLRLTRQSYYQGDLSSDKINRSAQLYLSVSSSLPMHELVELVPRRFKVATPDAVEKRVLAALPGTPLSHVTQVPSAIPVRPGFSYFFIEPLGALYDDMIKSDAICIYVPGGFDDLKLELMAIVQ